LHAVAFAAMKADRGDGNDFYPVGRLPVSRGVLFYVPAVLCFGVAAARAD
jgi:hypothetical protein